jgi:hypothetical protein
MTHPVCPSHPLLGLVFHKGVLSRPSCHCNGNRTADKTLARGGLVMKGAEEKCAEKQSAWKKYLWEAVSKMTDNDFQQNAETHTFVLKGSSKF